MPFSSLTSRLGPQQDRDRIPPLLVVDLGRRHYSPVLDLQHRLRVARKLDRIEDLLLLTEHDPVITTGRRAGRENILVSHDFLQEKNVTLLSTERGGDITFHGPGQLVGYPITRLGGSGRRVLSYVQGLEQTLIDTLAGHGVTASLDPANRGVWVGPEKIAAIGVRITRQITMHGFSLNVAVDLSYYGGIVPCGIQDKGVTSLDRLVPGVTIDEVKTRVVEHFRRVMGYDN